MRFKNSLDTNNNSINCSQTHSGWNKENSIPGPRIISETTTNNNKKGSFFGNINL